MSDLFEDGGEVWCHMISSTRLTFCRYLVITDDTIPTFIDNAAGGHVDRTSERYDRAYTRILQWRKNWFYAFTTAVDQLQQAIEIGHRGLSLLPVNELREIYGEKFSYEAFYGLMGTTCVVVDWRATLERPRCHNLYKTIFTYALL